MSFMLSLILKNEGKPLTSVTVFDSWVKDLALKLDSLMYSPANFNSDDSFFEFLKSELSSLYSNLEISTAIFLNAMVDNLYEDGGPLKKVYLGVSETLENQSVSEEDVTSGIFIF